MSTDAVDFAAIKKVCLYSAEPTFEAVARRRDPLSCLLNVYRVAVWQAIERGRRQIFAGDQHWCTHHHR